MTETQTQTLGVATSLSLTSKKQHPKTITLYERYDPDRLAEVLRCNNLPFKNCNAKEIEGKKKALLTYSKKKIFKNKGVEIQYVRKNNYGRYNCMNGVGLQAFQGDIRKYISGTFYKDIDIKNAHPVILQQVFTRFGIGCEQLGIYNANRPWFIKEYKLIDKTDILAMMNDDTLHRPLFQEIHDCIYKVLIPQLIQLNKVLFNRVLKEKKENIYGSFFSHYIQNIENDLLMSIFEYFENNDFTVGSLVFDGLMNETTDALDDDALLCAEKYVFENTGYKIELAYKPLETVWKPTFTEIPEKYRKLVEIYNEGGGGQRGLADMLAGAMRKNCKYLPRHTKKTFAVYDKSLKLWVYCGDCFVKNEMSKAFVKILKKFENLGMTVDLMEHTKEMTTSSFMSGVFSLMFELLKDEEFEDVLDSVRHLLPVENGVIDLRTGELRDRVREDYISRVSPVEYKGLEYDTAIWNDFFASIMSGKVCKIEFLQRLMGMGISGEVEEQLFMVFTGSGGNGKGLFMKCLRKLLGKYYCEMNSQVLIQEYRGNREVELVKIDRSRLAIFNELPDDNATLQTDLVKKLSGGDPIPCRGMYESAGDLTAYFLPILTTNNMPTVECDNAMRRRIIQVDFPVFFGDLNGQPETDTFKQIDLCLGQKLLDNLDGLLSWLVIGAVRWYANMDLKTNQPEEVIQSTKDYFDGCDSLQQFIDEECEVGDFRVRSIDIHTAYRFSQYGKRDITPNLFNKRMKQRGFIKKALTIDGKTVKGFSGIRIKNELPDENHTL